ncbi:RNA polymerase sigma-70 factor (ECF subfamily) [Salirhabdus euzebyi]|uniref:RNA polymerase sigma-70 factor (ECF subfamily) n=1 Tax=Salirhabdus euzebyi TaxID=394506 RepID=A0A841Q209_9BACI|nr:sigma-70 family RNA polymerase sigma factor [Salirhabdus euzebyi]MBB6452382.1 RNA polymerase sigma-70 factor (ECF subfamily) [Salirhabdus euzebyi]
MQKRIYDSRIHEEMNCNVINKEEVLKWLMEEYGQHVIRLAYTYVKDKSLAEDVAQDVFVKCYQKLDDFRQESSYKSWLYRITVNKCKDVLKSWNFKNVKPVEFFHPKSNPVSGSTPEQISITNEKNRQISQTVLSLPIKLREVVIMYYYEELKIEEVASLLNININTVKSRLVRSRQRLKKMMGGTVFE